MSKLSGDPCKGKTDNWIRMQSRFRSRTGPHNESHIKGNFDFVFILEINLHVYTYHLNLNRCSAP